MSKNLSFKVPNECGACGKPLDYGMVILGPKGKAEGAYCALCMGIYLAEFVNVGLVSLGASRLNAVA